MSIDPVCGTSVPEGPRAPSVELEGQRHRFCSEDCLRAYEDPPAERRRLRLHAFVSLALAAGIVALMNGVVASEPTAGPFGSPWTRWAMLALATPIQFWAGARLYRGLGQALSRRVAHPEALVAVGTSLAYGYSALATFQPARFGVQTYFDVSSLTIAFVLVGRLLAWDLLARAAGRPARLEALPGDVAVRVQEGLTERVPAAALRPGDRFRVGAGEAMPADGVIVEGSATVNESMLTGVQVPVVKHAGDEVVAGAVAADGSLAVEATRVGEDRMAVQAARSVDAARVQLGSWTALGDSAVRILVLLVAILALATFVVWRQVFEAPTSLAVLPLVAVLVGASPWALSLASRSAWLTSVGMAADQGILVRDVAQLQALAQADVVLFDKTGTLTTGAFAVTRVVARAGASEWEVLRAASAAEAASTHPLARAIVAHAKTSGIDVPAAREFEEVPGEGIEAVLDGRKVRVGSLEWVGPEVAQFEAERDRLRADGQTVLGVAVGGRCIGLLALADDPMPGAAEAVRTLQKAGTQVWMVTGDDARTAESLARRLGIRRVHARQRPDEKARLVTKLREKGHRVAFVGDGVGDAPALRAADAGLALGPGPDVARVVGGMLLLKPDPREVVNARVLAQRGRRKSRQNLAAASLYHAAMMPLAAAHVVDPLVAGAAMAASSAAILANALTIRWHPPALATAAMGLRTARVEAREPAAARVDALVDSVCGAFVDPSTSQWRLKRVEGTLFFCSEPCRSSYERTHPAGGATGAKTLRALETP